MNARSRRRTQVRPAGSARAGAAPGDSAPDIAGDPLAALQHVGASLARWGQTLAVGETSAGGVLAALIHTVAEHDIWFGGGIVVYGGSAMPLTRSLGEVARVHGVVSEPYANALARLARRTFGSDWALAESGIAGPQTGRRSRKPVGLVCLALAGPDGILFPNEETRLDAAATNKDLSGGEASPARGAVRRQTPDEECDGSAADSPDSAARGAHTRPASTWTATLRLADRGRTANQRAFAAAGAQFASRVLASCRVPE